MTPWHRWIVSLAVYAPSLLSRYSTQTLVIAIPWLLQARGIDAAGIARALLPFYGGALLFSGLASRWAPRWRLGPSLVAVMLVQALACLLCLQAEDLAWVAALRFLQGAATGLSRPLSQLWALERGAGGDATPQHKMRINVFVQAAIAVGTAAGSYAGLALGAPGSGAALLAAVAATLGPALFACACVGVVARLQPASAPAGPATDRPADPLPLQDWARSEPLAVGAAAVFLLSMAAYNAWPVVVPFSQRAAGDAGLLAALALGLSVQPLVFGIGQLVAARALQAGGHKEARLFAALLASHLASVVLLRLAAEPTHPAVFLALLLGGAGLVPALVYPLAMLLLMKAVDRIEPAHRQAWQRQLVFLFGLAGDIGQLLGGGLLALRALALPPAETLTLLAVLSLAALGWLRVRRRDD